jgi:hypothetical protein
MSAAAGQLALLDVEQAQPDWRVRESPRARRLTVRVFPGGRVEIVVPVGTRSRTVQQFVTHHRRWIDRKVEELRHLVTETVDDLPETVYFQAIDRRLSIRYLESQGSPRVTELASGILVRGDLSRLPLVRHVLHRWLLHGPLASRALAGLGGQQSRARVPAGAGSAATNALGQLLQVGDDQHQRLPHVPASRRGPIPVRP